MRRYSDRASIRGMWGLGRKLARTSALGCAQSSATTIARTDHVRARRPVRAPRFTIRSRTNLCCRRGWALSSGPGNVPPPLPLAWTVSAGASGPNGSEGCDSGDGGTDLLKSYRQRPDGVSRPCLEWSEMGVPRWSVSAGRSTALPQREDRRSRLGLEASLLEGEGLGVGKASLLPGPAFPG